MTEKNNLENEDSLAFQSIIGERGAEFKLGKFIGRGAHASVYETADGRFAVKVLHDVSQKRVQRFQKEIKFTQDELDHKNIVYCDSFHQGPEHVFGVFELVKEHRPLNQRPIVREKLVQIVEQCLDALDHAHGKGIIHRDIKPENIILDNENIPHITDFGIAKAAKEGSSTSSSSKIQQTGTMDGSIVGTAPYLSPEAAQGRVKELSVATDIFSFGTTCYEVFTGKRPFRAEDDPNYDSSQSMNTDHIYIDRIRQKKDPDFPRAVNPSLPEDLEDFTMMLMAPDPEDRLNAKEGRMMINGIREQENLLLEKSIISKEEKFMHRPLEKKDTKGLEKRIRKLEKESKKNRESNSGLISASLADHYQELGNLSPRCYETPKSLRGFGSEIKKLRRWDTKSAKDELKRTQKQLEELIVKIAKKELPRQYCLEEAAKYYQKVGNNLQSSVLRKKAKLERRRLDQLMDKEESAPPGRIKGFLTSPWPYAAASVLVLAAVAGYFFGYVPMTRARTFDRARALKLDASELFKAGKLLEARDKFESAGKEYAELPSDFNPAFLENLGNSKELVERAIQDSGKEKKFNEYFSRLDELISSCKFKEIENIFAEAEALHQELQPTSYDPIRKRLPVHAANLGRYKALTEEKKLVVVLEKLRESIQKKEFENANKLKGEAGSLYSELESMSHQEIRINLPSYHAVLEGLGKVLKKVDDDVRDLTTSLEKLYEFQEEIKKGSAAFVSGGLSRRILDTLSNRIERFNRLDYIDEGNVNPHKFKEASDGYKNIERAITQFLSGLDVNKKFLEVDSVLSYLERNLAAEDNMVKVSEAERALGYITEKLESIDNKIIPNLQDLDGRLAAAQERFEPVKVQVIRYCGMKKKAEEGKSFFDAGNYDEAERSLQAVLVSGYDDLIKNYSVKTRLEIIEVEKIIKNPESSMYRKNELDYDTDLLRKFRKAVDAYLKTWTGEMEVLRCLKEVKNKTKSGENIIPDDYGEWVEAQVKGVEGAEAGAAQYLEDRYQAAEKELLQYPATPHPKILEKRDALLSVLKGK